MTNLQVLLVKPLATLQILEKLKKLSRSKGKWIKRLAVDAFCEVWIESMSLLPKEPVVTCHLHVRLHVDLLTACTFCPFRSR